ncbi:MAG: tRNA (adenosine(37)-N6)-threonylcarbamoyltransferase complex dimerization subunit type 1 TsaB [Mycoplasmoidaceae bacterium]
MNHILFIDTSNKRLVLSFIFDDHIIAYKYIETSQNMTELFNPEIEQFFLENKIDKKKIEKIYLINGPGSFVGIKIGIVFANLYALLNRCEIYYLDSCSFQSTSAQQISIIDARSHLYYAKIMNEDHEIELLNYDQIKELAKKKNLEIIDQYDNYDFQRCWNHNYDKFIKTTEIIGNYVKKAI